MFKPSIDSGEFFIELLTTLNLIFSDLKLINLLPFSEISLLISKEKGSLKISPFKFKIFKFFLRVNCPFID